jgi:hypothetical protein
MERDETIEDETNGGGLLQRSSSNFCFLFPLNQSIFSSWHRILFPGERGRGAILVLSVW